MKGIHWLFVAALLSAAPAADAVIGGGEIIIPVTGEKNVAYSHEFHVLKRGFTCSQCHYTLFTTRARHIRMNMNDLQNGKSCGACHNGEQAFDVKANCTRCHSGG